MTVEYIVESCSEMIRHYLQRRVGVKHDIDDLVQEVLVAVMRRRSAITRENMRGYVYGICRHVLHRYFRSRRRRTSREVIDSDRLDGHATESDLFAELWRSEQDHLLRKAIQQLPDQYYLVVKLYLEETGDLQQLARLLHLNYATTRWRLSRARTLLRAGLREHLEQRPQGETDRRSHEQTEKLR